MTVSMAFCIPFGAEFTPSPFLYRLATDIMIHTSRPKRQQHLNNIARKRNIIDLNVRIQFMLDHLPRTIWPILNFLGSNFHSAIFSSVSKDISFMWMFAMVKFRR